MYFAFFSTEDDPLITFMYVIFSTTRTAQVRGACFSGVLILANAEVISRGKQSTKGKTKLHFLLLAWFIKRSPTSVLLKEVDIRELKQTRLRQLRECHLKKLLRVSAIISRLFKVITLANYPRIKFEQALQE